jgi:hypothetical protein
MPFSSPYLKQILVRVERDQAILNQLVERLEMCVEEVKKMIETIKS